MLITQDPITGSEKTPISSTEPVAALIEFYRAFNRGDMDLMSKNWLHSSEASMSNPLGGVKRGWSQIQEVYSKIFNGDAKVYVEYYDYSIHHSGAMFCAVGRERGFFERSDSRIDLAIRTSRIFRMEGERWKQVHHHGSIDNPELLAVYQVAVVGDDAS